VPRAGNGHVHSVFRRACNIELESGELVTLLDPQFGNLPSGIRCVAPDNSFALYLHPGQPARLAAGVVDVGNLRADFSCAPRWYGRVGHFDPCSPTAVQSVEEARAILCKEASPDGIAHLLLAHDRSASVLERAAARRLADLLPVLAQAAMQCDEARATHALSGLIGLGVGLTPAGDDFILGWLAALWGTAGVDRAARMLLRRLRRTLCALCLRTTIISAQQLRDAAHGHFPQRLTELLGALANGERIAEHTRRALACGHSSGADSVCGVLFALEPEALLRPLPMGVVLAAHCASSAART
jgi:hypothetical protein